MKITIRHQFESFDLEISNEATSDELLRTIASREGVVPTQVQAIFNHKIIKSDIKLKDIEITENSLIDIVISKPSFQIDLEDTIELPLGASQYKEGPSLDAFINKEKLRMLVNMGFTEVDAKQALQLANGNIQLAATYLPLDDDKIILIKTTRPSQHRPRQESAPPRPQHKAKEDVKHEQAKPEGKTVPKIEDAPKKEAAPEPLNIHPIAPNPRPEIRNIPPPIISASPAPRPEAPSEPISQPIAPSVREQMSTLPILPQFAARPEIKPATNISSKNPEQLLDALIDFLGNSNKLKVVTKLISKIIKQLGTACKKKPEIIVFIVQNYLNEKKMLKNLPVERQNAVKRLTLKGLPIEASLKVLQLTNWDPNMAERYIENILRGSPDLNEIVEGMTPNIGAAASGRGEIGRMGGLYGLGELAQAMTGRMNAGMRAPAPSAGIGSGMGPRFTGLSELVARMNSRMNPAPANPSFASEIAGPSGMRPEAQPEAKQESPVKANEPEAKAAEQLSAEAPPEKTEEPKPSSHKEKPSQVKLRPRGGFGPGRGRFGA